MSVQKQRQIWVFVIILRLFFQPRNHKYSLLKMTATGLPKLWTPGSVPLLLFIRLWYTLTSSSANLCISNPYTISFTTLQALDTMNLVDANQVVSLSNMKRYSTHLKTASKLKKSGILQSWNKSQKKTHLALSVTVSKGEKRWKLI